jgi:hypothetical protein
VSLFRRRPRRLPDTDPTVVASSPVGSVGAAAGAGPIGYTAGWAGLDVLTPQQYAGTFRGGQLTQLAGYVNEAQKRQGVEGLGSRWGVAGQLNPSTGYLITMRAGNPADVQRIVGGNNGGLGPITANQMRAAVTAAQIRQSSLSAVQWARSLSPNA